MDSSLASCTLLKPGVEMGLGNAPAFMASRTLQCSPILLQSWRVRCEPLEYREPPKREAERGRGAGESHKPERERESPKAEWQGGGKQTLCIKLQMLLTKCQLSPHLGLRPNYLQPSGLRLLILFLKIKLAFHLDSLTK